MKILDRIAGRLGFERIRPRPRNMTREQLRQLRQFAAGETSRLFADWTARNTSIDTDLANDLCRMRARSRQLCKDDDYAKGFLGLAARNVIGSRGVRLQMDVRKARGTSDTEANDVIEEAWREFSLPENFTVTGQHAREDWEQLAIKILVRDGELLIRKVPGFDNPHRFAVQILEPDYLDETFSQRLPNGNFVSLGVEYSREWRRPVAYWFRKDHPGNMLPGQTGDWQRGERWRVSALEILHRYIFDFPEQSRGIPWFHASVARLRHTGAFEEAALVAARVAACKMFAYVPKPDASGAYTGDDEDADGNPIEEIEPGLGMKLPSGFELETIDWQHPSAEFASFVKANLRGVAAGLGVSYHSLSSDLEGVNYSSSRTGTLEERETWASVQGWFSRMVCAPIFAEWLDVGLMVGDRLKGWNTGDFQRLNRPRFIGRRWAWVDPAKDTAATKEAVGARLQSRFAAVAEAGDDLEEIYRDEAREIELAKKYGVRPPAELDAPAQAKPTPEQIIASED